MTDEELSKVADLVFEKLLTKFHALDGVVGARGAKGEDGRQGERGIPGRDAKDGAAGKDGASTRLIVVYQLTETAQSPANPSGGTWDYETNTVTPPTGWLEAAPNHEDGYLWSSQAVFSSNGTQLQAWTQPIRLNGKDGGDGEDASDIEYVYKLTKDDKEIPTVPANDPNKDDFTGDWKDNPTGISESMKAEWMCSRLKQADGKWGNWIGPTLWSVWGSAGKDGDGVQYVYKQTKENKCDEITAVDNENLNEFLPPGWKDDPIGVTEDMPFEWVSKRKFDGTTLTWGNWSVPKLWASWGKKGDTGLSATFRYLAMLKTAEKPVIEDRKRQEPGDQWKKLVPELGPNQALWACQALVDGDGKIWCDPEAPEDKKGWLGPWLITGVDGEQGKTGPEPDYTIAVFKESELKPTKPTGNDPNSPTDGWQKTVPVETNDANWWACWGRVTHTDNPEVTEEDSKEVEDVIISIEWGDPLPLNGNMGNPCVLASFLVKNINGTKSGDVSEADGCFNQGISKVEYTISGALLKVTITPKAGYAVKATSANCNIGTTKWIKVNQSDKSQRSGGAMHAAHILIESSNNSPVIHCLSWSLGNKDNDTSCPREWGDWLTSFTMTIFGKVTRNNVGS